jgi:DNA-directed RNA polymerase specialized sigma24 family protein
MNPVLARRHERAFERVYQRHVGNVYRYALVVLSDEQGAEDVTKTTFRNAYQRFSYGRRPRQELNGLLSIAHDVCRRRADYPRLDDPFRFEERAGQLAASISCRDAELAVSRELDGALSRSEHRRLTLHLSSCADCATFARGQHAQRAALRALAPVPLPPGLRRFAPDRKFRGARASS